MHPTRKLRRRIIALALLVIVSVGSIVAFTVDRGPRKDVFLIILDTVRQDSLGCYGCPRDPTPNLDALAADGAKFDQAITPSGWTLPAIASLLTATWPTIHGAVGRFGSTTRLRDEVPTAPEILRERGFRTTGFANSAFVSPMFGVDRGFDVFDGKYAFNRTHRRADETIDAVLPHLTRRGSRSNFYMVHLFDGHLDYDPPPEHLARFVSEWATPRPPLSVWDCRELLGMEGSKRGGSRHVRGVYQGEVSFMDAEVGRLVETLKVQGRYEDATIVVVSDHGEEFLDHGSFEHGHTLYDELIRVPLIIKLPGRLDVRGTVIEAQVRTLDVMPTIFELCGIPVPVTFDGISLLSMILGHDRVPRFAYAEDMLYGPDRISGGDGRYKVVQSERPGFSDELELYDLEEDPGERRNLVRIFPDLARSLSRKLVAFRRHLLEASGPLSIPERVDMDPASIEKLRSLGYVR